MKIAITGASGYIGRYVLAEFCKDHCELTAVTRDAKRLQWAADRVRIVELDIAKPGSGDFDCLGRPDVLIHLAWDGLPNYRSLHHFEIELPAQYRFLKGLIEAGLPSLVVTGTCFEYGMQSGRLGEGMPVFPDNPYGYAKDALRRQLEFLRKTHSFDLTWCRLFYMFGEGQPKTSLFPQLKAAIESGQRVFDMSGGEQLRDFLPVSQVAGFVGQLARLGRHVGVVNVCSGRPVSVRNLVEGWLRENGWSIELNLGKFPYPDYEPMAFWGSNDYLGHLLKPPAPPHDTHVANFVHC